MWERYFRYYPPGFLTAEMVGRFMVGFASTPQKPVPLSAAAPWVKGRSIGGGKRKRTKRDAQRLAAGFAEAMRRKAAEGSEE